MLRKTLTTSLSGCVNGLWSKRRLLSICASASGSWKRVWPRITTTPAATILGLTVQEVATTLATPAKRAQAGGQPGRRGVTRSLVEHPDQCVIIPLTGTCACGRCGTGIAATVLAERRHRSVAIFCETRNGVRPISGAKNQATAMAFGGPRSSCIRPGAHSARRQDSRNDFTPCRMALHFISAGARAPHSDETLGPTATRGSSHSVRRLRPSLSCAPPVVEVETQRKVHRVPHCRRNLCLWARATQHVSCRD